jgi:DNA-binding beta-propeller fold protein YncE
MNHYSLVSLNMIFVVSTCLSVFLLLLLCCSFVFEHGQKVFSQSREVEYNRTLTQNSDLDPNIYKIPNLAGVEDIEINSNSGNIYLGTKYNKIIVLDGLTKQKIADIPLNSSKDLTGSKYILFFEPHSSVLYALDVGLYTKPGRLFAINGTTNVILRDITIENPINLIGDPKNKVLYISTAKKGIQTFETNTLRPIGEIGKNYGMSSFVVSQNNGKLYGYDANRSSILIFNKTLDKDNPISMINMEAKNVSDILFDEKNDKIIVSLQFSDRLLVIDGKKDSIIHTFLSGNTSGWSAPDIELDTNNNLVYMVGTDSMNFFIFDINKGLVKKIPLEETFYNLRINPNTGEVYLSEGNPYEVAILKLSSDENEQTIPFTNLGISVGNQPNSIGINLVTNLLYAVNEKSGTVDKIDLSTFKIVSRIPIGVNPGQILVNSIDNVVYVQNENDNYLTIINGTADKVVGRINEVGTVITSNEYPTLSLALSSLTDKIYAAVPNGVLVVDEKSRNITTTISTLDNYGLNVEVLSPDIAYASSLEQKVDKLYFANSYSHPDNNGSMLYELKVKYNETGIFEAISKRIPIDKNYVNSISVNPSTMMAYAATTNNSIAVIDLYSNKVTDYVDVGYDPWNLKINPATNQIYSVDREGGKVSVIDALHRNKLTKNIQLYERDPSGVAVDQKTNTVYVSNLLSDSISVIDGNNNKLLIAGNIKLQIEPPNTGRIECGNKEFRIGEFETFEFGTLCEAKPAKGFSFNAWMESIGTSSTRTVSSIGEQSSNPFNLFLSIIGLDNPQSKNINLTRGGTFIATFTDFQPPLSGDTLIQIWLLIASAVLSAWIIPLLVERYRTYHRRMSMKGYEDKISNTFNQILDTKKYETKQLDLIRKEIVNAATKGKITELQQQILDKKISTCYHHIFMLNLDKLERKNKKKTVDRGQNQMLLELREYITREYIDGTLNDIQFDRLNRKMTEYQDEK